MTRQLISKMSFLYLASVRLFFLCLLAPLPLTAEASVLGDLAANMQPDTWAEISNSGSMVNVAAQTQGGSGNIFTYSDRAIWDPKTRRMYFLGMDHCPGTCDAALQARHIYYDATTNNWVNLGRPSWYPTSAPKHAYELNTIDPLRRWHYRGEDTTGQAIIHRYNIDTGSESSWTTMATTGTNNCCLGMVYFPERRSILFSGGSGGNETPIHELHLHDLDGNASNTWTRNLCTLVGASAPYQPHILYNPVKKLVVVGGGSNGDSSVFTINPNGQCTAKGNAPINLGVQSTVMTVDPVTGEILVFTNSGTMWKWNLDTNVWSQVGGSIPLFNGDGQGTPVNGIVATPVDTYGVVLFATCWNNTTCTMWVYKGGTQTDHQKKCAQLGVIYCEGFETQNTLVYSWDTGSGPCNSALAGNPNYGISATRSNRGNTNASTWGTRCIYPRIDTAQKYSGSSSLRFDIETQTGADSSGYFTDVFERLDGSGFGCFAPSGCKYGPIVYVQWKQQFNTSQLQTNYSPDTSGWKQAIHYGEPPGGGSSSLIEVTMVNGNQRNVVQMYGQQGHDDYGIEDIAGCTYAKATSEGGSGSGYNSRPNYKAPLNSTCINYQANTWIEYTLRIEVRGAQNAPQSRVQLWVDGNLAVDYGQAKIAWGTPGPTGNGLGVGAFLLSPYYTNKDGGQSHAIGQTWYDDYIVSTQPIAFMGGSGPPPDTLPPAAPTNLRVQ